MRNLTIQAAMLERARKKNPHKRLPLRIRWDGLIVQTSDLLLVPREGRIRMELLHVDEQTRQGFDVKMDGGCRLTDGSLVAVLRTWADPAFEPMVEYDYVSRDGKIYTWNVYQRGSGDGAIVEKWAGNAGFWVEEMSPLDRIYHCSPGLASPPDFDSLVYRVTVAGTKTD
jgi:hypothetical protein